MVLDNDEDIFGDTELSCQDLRSPSGSTDAVIHNESVAHVRIYADRDCTEGSKSWAIGLDHFDGGLYTIDAILESFVGSLNPDGTTYYEEGAFSIRVPENFNALITEAEDGTGDFRLVKGVGTPGEC